MRFIEWEMWDAIHICTELGIQDARRYFQERSRLRFVEQQLEYQRMSKV